jgi:POT family proton-dependent oligopeptide transporter
MTTRRVLTILALLAMVFLERFAYYGFRAFFVMELVRSANTSVASAAQIATGFTIFAQLTPVLGGALALAIRARPTALAGALVASLGYAAMGASGNPLVGVIGVALGAGLLRPCLWAIAAEELARETAPSGADPADTPKSPRRFPAMAAAAVLLGVSIEVGALLAAPTAAVVLDKWGFAAVSYLEAAEMFACAIVAAVVLFAPAIARAAPGSPELSPYRAAGARAPAPPREGGLADGIAGVALLLAAIAPYMISQSLTGPDPRVLGLSPREIGFLYSVNPVVAIGAGVCLAIAFVVIAAGRHTVPLPSLVGAALVVYAVGVGFAAAASSVAAYVVSGAITGLAEAAIGPIALAYAALVAPPRGAPLVLGVWFLLSGALGQMGARLDSARGPVLVGLALLCVISGCILLVTGRTFHSRFFDPKGSSSPGVQ